MKKNSRHDSNLHTGGLNHTQLLQFLGRNLAVATDGVVVVNAEGQHVFINEPGRRLLESASSKQSKDVVLHYPDGKAVPQQEVSLWRALHGETTANSIAGFKKPDDSEAFAAVSAGPVRDDEGVIIGAFIVFQDATERLNAEKKAHELSLIRQEITQQLTARAIAAENELARRDKLEKAHAELETRVEELAEVAQRKATEIQGIIENMVDGVFVCDAEGRVTLANESGMRLLGFANIEEATHFLVESPELLHIRHPDGKPISPPEMPLARALLGETVMLDGELMHSERTRRDMFIRVNAAPIKDKEGKVVGAVEVARDVTELIELERLKDQFISNTAHELKTPVTIVKGYAQVLLRAAKDLSPQRLSMLKAIDQGADRIVRIVNDLLYISRLQIGQTEIAAEPIDLLRLTEQIVGRMSLAAEKHLIRLVRGEPAVVKGDRDSLEAVLFNLVDNAIKYSPPEGNVEVAVDVWDNNAVVSVRDHGAGVPKDKQDRLFERFYRAHAGPPYKYGGMGVGLYISREIITRHGGKIWYESEEGKGSTFYFSLPLA